MIHTAAAVRVDCDAEGEAHAVNLVGTRNVIAACIAGGLGKLVHVSSIHAFGPLRGTSLGADSPLALAWRVPCGATKAQAHAAVLEAARDGKLDASLVCPSGLLGPGDRRPTPVGGMLLGIAGGRLPCLVRGGYWWCDVRDVAAAVADAVAGGEAGAVYYPSGWLARPLVIAGLVLAVGGAALNVWSDYRLSRLRKAANDAYVMPSRGPFDLVSCPNLLGEIVEWVGVALLTWSLSGLAFAMWTIANLVPRALWRHSWYRKTFADYPRRRRALLPALL